ncbi:hypothetical protein NHX12_014212 [Muraenolepis orangiensis]|uniref:Uncharacterized protein n=1 Tax=Muraenolepis orangiensis TaxID=630683 RepID=A0A9Q0I5E2_9TELE|nr:hypothetical protein NHX12_014212 [Muraenolepis orangiensis]
MTTRLARLQGSRGGEAEGLRERDAEDTIRDLEVRVATLEGQKGALQGKLSLARQHLLDLGGRSHYRPAKGLGPLTLDPMCCVFSVSLMSMC